MKKKIKNKGILFWVTGLSGSGKTSISKLIKKDIIKNYGPTLLVSGDDLRTIFHFNKYSLIERQLLVKKFCNFAKFITNQNINLIFATVAMMHAPRAWNKKNIDNYIEIFIKTKINKIIDAKKKKIYHKKNIGDLVGLSIKPQLPKKPDIIITNDFDKPIKHLSKVLMNKIKHII
jgi:adenylylsulfate kinase-like enzyme